MMAVIVDHRDAALRAGAGEAPLDAAEAGQRLAQHLFRDRELARHRDRGQRVLHVVAAGHGQAQAMQALDHQAAHPIAQLDVELGAVGIEHGIERAHVRLRAEAIGDQAPVGDPAEQRLDLGMIDAQRREAVERQVLDKALEGGAHGVEIAPEVEMLGVDVGDHGDARRQAHEGAVGLVGLDHHPVALAVPGVGAVGVDDAAVDHGRVEVGGIEQGRDQRGRGGLAVGAGDRDRPFQAHQLAQHLGAPHDRHAGAARRLDLGIVRP